MNQHPRLAAFVITFRRNEILRSTLTALTEQSLPPSRILVVDNGRSRETADVVESYSSCGAIYHESRENLGPAGAAAYALEALVGGDWDAIYWGDDDDPPQTPDTLERLVALLLGPGRSRPAAVGAFGARWDWKRGRYARLPDDALIGPVDVDVIGGNGQLILNPHAVRETGLPDPALFFGLEEIEYCLRFRAAGLRLAVDGDLMRHYRSAAGRLGLPTAPRRSWIPRKGTPTWRQYYSTRNYIHLMRSRFQAPHLAHREAIRAVGRAIGSWGRGPVFGLRFSYLQLLAVLHGYRGHLGRTVAPGDR